MAVILFWDYLIFYQNVLLPQVKQGMNISRKNGIYQLPSTLPKDSRLRFSGN